MTRNNETMLERLASGEMGMAEESDFLARCETEPELWRSATLAMVEHRRLAAALLEFAQDSAEPRLSPEVLQSPHSTTRWSLVLTVAASLLLALLSGLTFGYWAGSAEGGLASQTPRSAPQDETANMEPATIVYVQPASVAPHSESLSHDSGTNHSGMTLAALESERVVPNEARSIIRDVGFEIDEQPVIYILNSDDGQQWGVPSTNFELRYVNVEN